MNLAPLTEAIKTKNVRTISKEMYKYKYNGYGSPARNIRTAVSLVLIDLEITDSKLQFDDWPDYIQRSLNLCREMFHGLSWNYAGD